VILKVTDGPFVYLCLRVFTGIPPVVSFMLRTLLRRAKSVRLHNVMHVRKGVVSNTRKAHLDFLAAVARKRDLAAARIQAMKRRWDAIALVMWMRNRKLAATFVQRVWRGVLGRRIAHEERMKLIRVVKTKYQMTQLKKRCQVVSRFGDWQELRDPHTNHVFYYFGPTGDSQWNPPTGEELGDILDYRCTFEDCQQSFPHLLALEKHREDCHRWMCDACFTDNTIDAFPVCEHCGNTKGNSGRSKTEEYEEEWETKCILKDSVENPMTKRIKVYKRNTLTELRPQSAADRRFFEARDRVLKELKARPSTVDSRGTMLLLEDRGGGGGGGDEDDDEDDSEFEWPHPKAQKGPISRHAYERKTRYKKETLKKKKKAGENVLEKLDGQALMAGEELRLNLDPRSKIDNEIRKYTKERPITPSIVTKLTGTKLHEWFELQIIEEENEALEPHGDVDNDEEQREHAAIGPLGDMNTESFAVIRNHNPSLEQSAGAARGSADALPIIHGSSGSKRPMTTSEAPVSERRRARHRPKTAPQPVFDLVKTFSGEDLKSKGKEMYRPLIQKGTGARTFPSGAVYRGAITAGIMEGEGAMKYGNGDIYKGAWASGRRNGLGTFLSKEGVQYEGEWRDGTRHGHGRLTHPSGEEYIGQWEDGCMSGHGTLTSANGDRYEGRFLNSRYHGMGRFTKANGHTFTGVCRDGKANGKGIIRYATGETYKGDWQDDQRHGKGVGTFPNGTRYVGDWERGKFNGKGKFILPNGEKYVGNWTMGKRDGYGKATFENGDIYVGTWRQDKVLGQGVMYYAKSGNLYDGAFAKGMRNGVGTLKLRDGGVFRGFFKDGSIHGRGIFNYGNGDVYKGYFEHGHKHGKGHFVWSNGNEYKGMFRHDKVCGHGNMKYAVGHEYAGEWYDGKKHGEGTFYYNDGNMYEGEWDADRRHGIGKFTWNRLIKSQVEYYDGSWVNDRREGKGLYQYKDGSRFEGNWVNGIRDGEGVFQYPDGSFYTGHMKDDKRHGIGTFHAANNAQYTGEWFKGVMHGVGVLLNQNGDKYEGEFRNGKKEGDGVVTYKDGNIYSGQWKGGRRLGHGQYLYQARDEDLTSEKDSFEGKAMLRMSVFGY
jgi:hypothetical protein